MLYRLLNDNQNEMESDMKRELKVKDEEKVLGKGTVACSGVVRSWNDL
jgi:hypothetical protein